MNVQELISEKVRTYYLKGLNYSEIGKLLDCSPRTVQRYMKKSGAKKEITEPKTIQMQAFELSGRGFSYSEIAKKLRVTKTTVYLWHRKRKAEKQAATPEI
jgi:DNA-directed RNA polymerase specialized sigma24 family protein